MSQTAPTPASPLFTDEWRTDAFGVIERLRREDPVHWVDPLQCWVVTRHDLVRQLFTDPHCTPDRRHHQFYVPPEGEYLRWVSENSLFAAPPDQHARQRRLVSAALTPRAVRRMEGQVRDVVEQFAAPLVGRTGVVDVMAEFTDPIPNTVISRITGIPAKGNDEARFRRIAGEVLGGINPFADAEARRITEAAFEELAGWVRDMAQERRTSPREDLISDLVEVHDMDDRMTNDEIVLMIVGLLAAGTETTALAGKLGVKALLEHPDQLEKLRGDRSLLPSAVNEVLRFDFGATIMLPRYVMEDFELEGRPIRKGQLLLLSFAGAHRDPAVYPDPDPDRFDVERDNKDLVIFGRGPHFCLGANLARQELGFILGAALDFLPPGAKLVPEQMQVTWQGIFARNENLPVDFG